MTRFAKLVTTLFALLALSAFGLRLMNLFSPPADRPPDRPPAPRHTQLSGRA